MDKNNKQKYRAFCTSEPGIPLFSQAWWLDAVCGEEGWHVAMVEKDGTIMATMPYIIKKRLGFTIIGMPALTKTLGPWLRNSYAKYAKKLTLQKKLMTELIKKLPKHDMFDQNFHYTVTNWLPFYWKGFEQTTLYSYVVEDLDSANTIWDKLLPKIRTDIKKAENRFRLEVSTEPDIEVFLDLNEMTFKRQNMSLPYSRELVHRLDAACKKREARKMFFAKDSNGEIHSAVYIVWDKNTAYYLMGGSNPRIRNSGANSLCLWEAIKFTSTVTKTFDFEGSMIESVERFFRAFGARQVPYSHVTRRCHILKIIHACLNIANIFLKR